MDNECEQAMQISTRCSEGLKVHCVHAPIIKKIHPLILCAIYAACPALVSYFISDYSVCHFFVQLSFQLSSYKFKTCFSNSTLFSAFRPTMGLNLHRIHPRLVLWRRPSQSCLSRVSASRTVFFSMSEARIRQACLFFSSSRECFEFLLWFGMPAGECNHKGRGKEEELEGWKLTHTSAGGLRESLKEVPKGRRTTCVPFLWVHFEDPLLPFIKRGKESHKSRAQGRKGGEERTVGLQF